MIKVTEEQYRIMEGLLDPKLLEILYEQHEQLYGKNCPFPPGLVSHSFRVRRAKGLSDPEEVKYLIDKLIEHKILRFGGKRQNAIIVG